MTAIRIRTDAVIPGMSQATIIVQQIYEAFGRGDVQGILDRVSDDIDWEFVGSPALAYAGNRRTREQVADFFAGVAQADDVHAFEPRELIDGGEHVTVLGWEKSTARETGKPFESEWAHIWTIKGGKATRWRGFFNTAARYGL